ncbi:hypothetical protein AAT19DRAFT_13012 [Rhodotorula toruloides]|uniref:Uncharacterized protein n=1 Tax=Rhodotorula toruloides TaxID=5286 RepID=A0A2T0ADB2_RHOTO|nr:hypothetical protein AAT19DRAFT_13012 [Rhodotorula toruloides]
MPCTRTGRPRTSTVRTRPLYFEARWLTLPFPRHRPPSFYPRLFRPFHSHAHSDGGLKRFIKDRQAKHQWDDADEADFIKGASSSGSRAVCLALDEGLTVRRGADSSGERVGQGRQVPGEQDRRTDRQDHQLRIRSERPDRRRRRLSPTSAVER